MVTALATAASPRQLAVPVTDRPPAAPDASSRGGGAGSSFPTNVGDWLVAKLGRAAFPVAIAAGGAAGAGLGMLTLGPVGAVVGGVAGGMLGALVVGLRP